MIQMGDIVADDTGRLMYVVARTTDGKCLCMWRETETVRSKSFDDTDLSLVRTIDDARALLLPGVKPKAPRPVESRDRWYLADTDRDQRPDIIEVEIVYCDVIWGDGLGQRRVPFELLRHTKETALEAMHGYLDGQVNRLNRLRKERAAVVRARKELGE